jgi:hypothetical protein
VQSPGGGDRGRDVAAEAGAVGRAVQPRGDRPGDRIDVGVERGDEGLVVARVLPDDIEHGGTGAAGVVQIGQAVPEPGTEVQQSGRGPSRHPAVTVRRPCRDTLEQAEDPAHLRIPVERRHEVHL